MTPSTTPLTVSLSRLPQPTALSTLDDQRIAAMRLVLAGAGLLIILIDPAEPDRFVFATYATLGLYAIYSLLLYGLAVYRSEMPPALTRGAHWIDVGWYTVLIALSTGTNSIFFFGFFFAILIASFRFGLSAGLQVTVASTILFTGVGLAAIPAAPAFELNRFLLRPVFLLVLGYMIASLGGFEVDLKERLALLREVSALSNPRFGVDRTIGRLMARLVGFYHPMLCLWITMDPLLGPDLLRRAADQDPEGGAHAVPLPAGLPPLLLSLPAEAALVYHGSAPLAEWAHGGPDYQCFNIRTGTTMALVPEVGATVAATLDARSFITIPLRQHQETVGRLYLTAARRHAFHSTDVAFLLQVLEQVTPVIDNIRLVDQLASSAAEEERRKIARDLHDSVIQPYIGLQLGLAAVRRKLITGADITPDLDRLAALANESIIDLRAFVGGLHTGSERAGSLLPGVRRFAERFSAATGIRVLVAADGDLRLNDRLSAEVFQMVAEGLSNVRRHTPTEEATVVLQRQGDRLRVCIENPVGQEGPPPPFTPRSLTERAQTLGGQAHIEQPGDRTSVVIEIPL
jgi:signal transduction histidine kinase